MPAFELTLIVLTVLSCTVAAAFALNELRADLARQPKRWGSVLANIIFMVAFILWAAFGTVLLLV